MGARGPAGAFSYDFDEVGNVLQKSDLGVYAYDALVKPNAVRAVGGRPVEYDENGAVQSYAGRTFTFDPRGELRKVETAEATTEYLYDYEGLRTFKRVRTASGTHETLYLDKFAEVRDGKLWKYVYLGDQRVARVVDVAPTPPTGAGILGPVSGGAAGFAVLALVASLALACVRRLRRMARAAVALASAALIVAADRRVRGRGLRGKRRCRRPIARVHLLPLGSSGQLERHRRRRRARAVAGRVRCVLG